MVKQNTFQNKQLDQAFSALGDGTRREIVQMLMQQGAPDVEPGLRVSDLAEPFDMSLAAVSKHIAILERASLVKRSKKGREVRVSLNPKPLMQVQDWLRFHEKFWVQSLNKLDKLIKEDLS